MNSTSTVGPPGEEVARSGSGPEGPGTPGGSDTTDATQGDSLQKDDLFHLLQNSRRRAVLRYLRGREGPVRMRDVAEQVAAWEHDTTVAALRSDERQRVYVALYQSHLDTLADAGVIEYDKSRGVIEPRPLLDRVALYTDLPDPTGPTESSGATGTGRGAGDDAGGGDQQGDVGSETSDDGVERDRGEGDGVDSWDRRYLGVSAAGSVLLVGTALDVAALEAVPGVAAGALVLLAFSVLTAWRLVLDDHDGERARDGG